jgi:5'-3' exonuclease
VDGTYELFRAFYGAPSRKGKGGQELGATLSLGRSLSHLASGGEFTHFAVAFDSVIESFRNELFEGYKTGEGIDPDLLSQFPLAEQVTEALGLVVLRMTEFEADDGLATVAAQCHKREDVAHVVIASPDKDLMQCVVDKVVTWDRLRDVRYDAGGVEQKMGVLPESIPDFLALVGDSADGIPGVPRWGAKSSALLLSRYCHLEDIPRDEREWDIKVRGAAALAEQLRSHEQEALLYRKLATLCTDVPLPYSLDDMQYSGTDEKRLKSVEETWGISILPRRSSKMGA